MGYIVGAKEPGMEGWRDRTVGGNDAEVEVFIGMAHATCIYINVYENTYLPHRSSPLF